MQPYQHSEFFGVICFSLSNESPFLRMSNQVCPIVPVARLAQWSTLGLRRLGPIAQRIRFPTIGLMLFDRGHAKDVPLLGRRFWQGMQGTVFKLPKVHRNYRKIIFFVEKRVFNLTLYRMVMPIGTPFLKEKINN